MLTRELANFPTAGPRRHLRRRPVTLFLVGFLAVAGAAGWGGYQLGTAAAERLGQRVGQLQGEVQRLNALGARLAEMAHLDPALFDFGRPTPMGGPEEYDFNRTDAGDLVRDVKALSRMLDDRGHKLDLLESLIAKHDLGDPRSVTGSPVPTGWLSSTFGARRDPINGRRSFHQGIDLVAKLGTEVVAVADGVVEHSGWRNGYGRTIEIRHPGGLVTRYAHNRELFVEPGTQVRQGQGIATVGSSGRTTGAHLHFEVLSNGAPVDPLHYVQVTARADGES